MQSEDTRVLTSWKEIAGHLEVTARTAQLWEKRRGLPVRRMPGPRGRVYLRIDEYEAWLASGEVAGERGRSTSRSVRLAPTVESTAVPGAVVGRSWPLVVSVAIVSALFGMLAAPRFLPGTYGLAEPTGSRVPVRAYVVAGELIVENAAGAELWRKRFEPGLQRAAYDSGALRPAVADVDGDGIAEVLFPRRAAARAVADILLCYSAGGEEMWRFRPGRELENDKQVFDDVFHIGHYAAVELGDGRRLTVVSAIHHIYEPTQLALLGADGRPVAEYWHSGHLGHREENLALADLDGDGIKEIYAAGVNNARQSATLVVLDPDTMAGASRDPHGFQLRGFETGHETARVFFPRSSMNRQENRYNVANGVFPGSHGIAVGTVELYGRDDKPGIVYELALDLTLRHIGLSDVFKATHEKLVRQQAIGPTTLEAELELLWQEGIRVMRPADAMAASRADAGQ